MDAKRKSLLTFGFVRNHCKSQNIECIPDEIITLFIAWLFFNDYFDTNLVHPLLKMSSNDNKYQHLSNLKKSHSVEWPSAIGTTIIGKGEKFEWKFAMSDMLLRTEIMIGIIDNDRLKENKPIKSFYNAIWNGWALYCYGMIPFHNGSKHGPLPFYYAKQFRYKSGDVITMILDLSQEKYKNGALSFDIDAELENKDKPKLSNKVLFSDLDVDREYRMAVAIRRDVNQMFTISLIVGE